MTDNIQVLKLITGEEIFGAVKFTATVAEIHKPLVIIGGQQRDPKTGEIVNINQIIPWAMNIKGDTVEIDRTHVLYNSPANDELASMYQKATGKIQAPPQGLVMPK